MSNKRGEKFVIGFSIVCSCIIVLIKFFGWLETHSNSILASLVDSILDIISSFVNMLAILYSSKPADEDHRFGHEKVEDLAILFQSAFFGVSGIFIFINGIYGFFYPRILPDTEIGIKVIFASIAITSILIIYQSYVYRKTKSSIVRTDRLHYTIDLLTNIGVVISLYISSYYKAAYVDSVFSIILAIFMVKPAIELITKAFANLMDKEFDEEKKKIIVNIVKAHSEVLGMHDIKTRQAGSKVFIQFHIEFDGETKLKHSHEITEIIIEKLQLEFPGADIIIHQDPYGIDEHVEYPFEYNK